MNAYLIYIQFRRRFKHSDRSCRSSTLEFRSSSYTASAFLLRAKPLVAKTIEKREISAKEVKGFRYSVK